MMSLFWEEFNFPFSFGPVVTGPVFRGPMIGYIDDKKTKIGRDKSEP